VYPNNSSVKINKDSIITFVVKSCVLKWLINKYSIPTSSNSHNPYIRDNIHIPIHSRKIFYLIIS
jgi:hypothetical protein